MKSHRLKEDDNDDTSIQDNYDHNVGVGLVAVHDVEELIEFSNVNLKHIKRNQKIQMI